MIDRSFCGIRWEQGQNNEQICVTKWCELKGPLTSFFSVFIQISGPWMELDQVSVCGSSVLWWHIQSLVVRRRKCDSFRSRDDTWTSSVRWWRPWDEKAGMLTVEFRAFLWFFFYWVKVVLQERKANDHFLPYCGIKHISKIQIVECPLKLFSKHKSVFVVNTSHIYIH